MEDRSVEGIAHIVAVNMGYGHERPASVLRHLAPKGRVTIANEYEGIPKHDRALWESKRRAYETVSRFQNVPLVGRLASGVIDELQKIADFYPRRDLSRPSLQIREIYSLIENQQWGRHLIDALAKHPIPLVSTFFSLAFAAEEFDYPGDIYIVACDADIGRVWAPLIPKKSRIRYFAPTGRVVERLKAYGVREENIFFTGFPLPTEAIGGHDATIIKSDLRRRMCNLDPRAVFMSHARPMVDAVLGSQFCRSVRAKNGSTISLTFAVGGAGAQSDIAVTIARSLRRELLSRNLQLNLVAGTRTEVAEFFRKELMAAGLASAVQQGSIRIVFSASRAKYFATFTTLMRETDVLWTRPSELSFFAGLGIPIIMAPTVGSQEDCNRQWLRQVGAGVDQLDPRYVNEWLFDWVNNGALARMAWNGYVEAPTHGAYRIEDILRGNTQTMHPLPLVV